MLAGQSDCMIRKPLLVLATGLALSIHAAPPVVISEFLATNARGLKDARGGTPDWIELHNRSGAAVDLAGYRLTDNARRPDKWVLPAVSLPAGGRLVIHATGREQRDPAHPLEAPFKLAGDGGYLALSAPDGEVATAFSPGYPVQLPDVSFGFATPDSAMPWYLPRPTPGKPNLSEGERPGPALAESAQEPQVVRSGEPVRVSVRAIPNGAAIAQVRAVHRVMFGTEKVVALNDAGTEGDAKAADGVWTGTIPTDGAADGTMVRWRFEAVDAAGATNRWPLFPDRERSSRYLGTVMGGGAVTSALPVFHLFVERGSVGEMDSDSGARACVWHDGEFYDNIRIKIRGNTTAGFPKKSHRLEFNADHPLRHGAGGGRIRNTSLMAEWGDPSYLRQHLSFWLMAQAGVPAPFHEPVRVQLNGKFFQLAMHSQVLGEELLERTGLDPDGALYKAVGTVTPDMNSSGGMEKKTRRQEDYSDYMKFSEALGRRRTSTVREAELFDRCDIPGVINYMAVARLTQEDDDIWANMSLYRDAEGSGRWRPVAFDMNVSWGLSFGAGGILANQDEFRSHPFWGASGIGSNQGHNELYDVIVRTTETREMLVRRMRTLMDRYWQPPGTPEAERVLERHIAEMLKKMAPEAALDRAMWGESWNAAQGATPERSMELGVRDLKRRFIDLRRTHFYVTHCATNEARRVGVGTRLSAGIPGPQPDACVVRIAATGLGETQRGDWIRLTNTHPFAVDVSGWKLGGDVKFPLPAGMVIPSRGEAIVAASESGFLSRTNSPMRGQRSLVVGGFKGSLRKARRVDVIDAAGRVVDQWTAPAKP
jgi:spore coat protein CotH